MRSAFERRWSIGLGAGTWLLTILAFGSACAQQGDFTNAEDVQVLTRGPVHEAFANLAESQTAPGRIFSNAPPEDIEELPPDRQPDGDNVAWIPGYWSWDDDREDYIWLSGVWRDVPPDRQWVPGYWTDARGGWRFVSGFWSDVSRNEIDYLPAPPAPLEMGPSSPSVGVGFQWAPGSWVWLNTRYAWQPGYWVAAQPNWVWTPAHYVWTPRGYVYVSAFWDYDIGNRGMMFAPVYYSSPVYRRPNYYYSPSIVIDLSFMLGHFFVHSGSHHYYYGDYYADRHRGRGYQPWYSRHDRYDRRDRHYYSDPLYASYRSKQIRRDRDWDKHVEEQYEYRRKHVEARPPGTFSERRETRRKDKPAGDHKEPTVAARRLDQVPTNKTQTRRLRPVEEGSRKEIQARSRDVKSFRTERKRIEVEADSVDDVARSPESTPEPPRSKQPRARDTDKVQHEPGRTTTQPSAAEHPAREATRARPEPKKAQREAKKAKPEPKKAQRAAKPEPEPTKSGAQANATRERGRDAERAKPVRRALRKSPIAARRSDAAKAVPPPPEIPKPLAEPSDAKRKRQQPGDAQQEKSKARGTKDDPIERSPRDGDATNPR